MSNPEGRSSNRFFANKGERIVFWVAIVGLGLVVSFSLFRYFQMKEMVEEYHSAQGHHQQVMDRNKELEKDIENYKEGMDSLKEVLNGNASTEDSLLIDGN